MNRRMMIRILVLPLALALVWPAASGLCQSTSKPDPIETENFYFEPRPESPDTFWIVEESTNKPIGYAKWDPILRRYTLFNFENEYKGFYQATLGQRRQLSYQPYYDTNFSDTFEGAHYYQQYLGYDKNNRYMGVFILSLGGRPKSPDVPFGELGGKMVLYKIGNIPAQYPPSIEPFTPDYDRIKELLDHDVTNPTPGYNR